MHRSNSVTTQQHSLWPCFNHTNVTCKRITTIILGALALIAVAYVLYINPKAGLAVLATAFVALYTSKRIPEQKEPVEKQEVSTEKEKVPSQPPKSSQKPVHQQSKEKTERETLNNTTNPLQESVNQPKTSQEKGNGKSLFSREKREQREGQKRRVGCSFNHSLYSTQSSKGTLPVNGTAFHINSSSLLDTRRKLFERCEQGSDDGL